MLTLQMFPGIIKYVLRVGLGGDATIFGHLTPGRWRAGQ
jgi:hypothetical protein